MLKIKQKIGSKVDLYPDNGIIYYLFKLYRTQKTKNFKCYNCNILGVNHNGKEKEIKMINFSGIILLKIKHIAEFQTVWNLLKTIITFIYLIKTFANTFSRYTYVLSKINRSMI